MEQAEPRTASGHNDNLPLPQPHRLYQQSRLSPAPRQLVSTLHRLGQALLFLASPGAFCQKQPEDGTVGTVPRAGLLWLRVTPPERSTTLVQIILLEFFPRATAAGRLPLPKAPLSLWCYTRVYAHTHTHTCTRPTEHMLAQNLAETEQIRVRKQAL